MKLQDLNEDIGTDNDQDNYGLLHRDSAGMYDKYTIYINFNITYILKKFSSGMNY